MRARIHQGTIMLQPSGFSLAPTLALPLLLSGCLTNPVQHAIDPTRFETPEYRAQMGLAVIQASTLYARGGTGQG